MRTKRIAALAATGCGAVLALAAPVGAQSDPDTSITVSPTSGPAGTSISVSGGSCVPEGQGPVWVEVLFVDFLGTCGVSVVTVRAEAAAEPDVDGSWATTLAAPDTTPGDYVIFTTCLEGDEEPVDLVEYDDAEFEVTGGGTEPTAPSTPTTTPPVTVPGDDDVPPPATPVVTPPDYTG